MLFKSSKDGCRDFLIKKKKRKENYLITEISELFFLFQEKRNRYIQ